MKKQIKFILLCIIACVIFFSCGGEKEPSAILPTIEDLSIVEEKTATTQTLVANIEAVEPSDGFENSFYDSKISSRVDALVSDIVASLSNHTNLRIVDRTKINDIQMEHAFQNSEWSSEEKTAEIGMASNADIIINLTAFSENEINVEFTDINTMQAMNTVVSSSSVSNLSSFNLSKLIQEENSNLFTAGTYYYTGITKSQQSYTVETEEFITPYGKYSPVGVETSEVSQILSRKMQDIYSLNIDEDDLVLIETERGDLIYASASLNLKEAEIFNANGRDYSTQAIGTIRIREDDGPKLIDGTLFFKEDRMAIHFASENADGTGFAYFINFEK